MAIPMDHEYLIALGSNLGDRAAHLARARGEIARRLGPVLDISKTYETEPLGAADQLFFNAAVVARSNLAPQDALAILLAIEADLGRVRRERWGNRVIDLDLLLWRAANDAASTPTRPFAGPGLAIPHPAMLDRSFVLVPACDVAGAWIHPGTGRSLEAELELRGYARS